MILRNTSISEIDRVMEILADGRDSLRDLGIDQWQGGYPFREAIAEDVKLGRGYVVEEDGKILATAVIDLQGEPTYDKIEGAWLSRGCSSEPDYGCVHRLAVAKESRGRGAARFILDSACQIARSAGCVSLRIDTHPGNVPMRSLIESCGFEFRGIILIAHAGEGTPERVAFEKRL